MKNLYGELINLINKEESYDEWESLTENQRQGIVDAEMQFKKGQFIDHDAVMKKFRMFIDGK